MTTRQEQAYEETLEYQRALWRWCAASAAAWVCKRRYRSWPDAYLHRHLNSIVPQTYEKASSRHCPLEQEIIRLLENAIDDVRDLAVFIRKTDPDIAAFEESRMTREQLYG